LSTEHTNMNRSVVIIIRVIIGILLLYAAFSKANALSLFAVVIRSIFSDWLPFSSNGWLVFAGGVVFVESFLGASLVLQYRPRLVSRLALFLFCMFTVLLSLLLIHENPVSCGCLGISPKGVGTRAELWFGVLRNGFVIALLLYVLARMKPCLKECAE